METNSKIYNSIYKISQLGPLLYQLYPIPTLKIIIWGY
jgi:hypothetical protein